METAFGWLGQIFDAILRFVPRVLLVRETHEGIKFQTGRIVKVLKCTNGLPFPLMFLLFGLIPMIWFRRTGIHIYWPLVTEYEIVPIRRQTTNLVEQYLSTKDCKTVGVSGILVFEVYDVKKLLTRCYDYEDTIRDLALAAIKKVITSHTISSLQENSAEVDKELTEELKKELKIFGVKVIRVTLSDLAECKMLGHWGSIVNITNI